MMARKWLFMMSGSIGSHFKKIFVLLAPRQNESKVVGLFLMLQKSNGGTGI